MPVMDGYEATRKIRALPGGAKVKIVALTASVFGDDRAATMAAGCDAMLPMPINEERLFALMGELLGVRDRYAEQASTQAAATPVELDFSVLSSELLQKLIVAANALDVDMMKQLVVQLRATHSDIAIALENMMEEFRFDRIAELCLQALAKP